MARGTTTRPRDRFDDVPVDLARVGAHRAPARRGRGLITFAWAALATGVLVGAGVLGLGAIERSVSATGATTTSGASASASAAPAATVDPNAKVVVLNATTTNGLAASAAAKAKAAGWTVESIAAANSTNTKLSTVYYGAKGQEGAALGLAKSLGIGRTAYSTQFNVSGQTRLTVILGTDFVTTS